jgi:hypothetical protein
MSTLQSLRGCFWVACFPRGLTRSLLTTQLVNLMGTFPYITISETRNNLPFVYRIYRLLKLPHLVRELEVQSTALEEWWSIYPFICTKASHAAHLWLPSFFVVAR